MCMKMYIMTWHTFFCLITTVLICYSVAGIECVVIKGYAKGHGYLPGDSISASPNHVWNAVCINDQWYLVDCTWGSGFIREGSWEFSQEFTAYYLLTNPRDFIRDHLPCDEKWQLLDETVSASQYENWAVVKPSYFINGVQSKDADLGIINIKGKTNIHLTTKSLMYITYKLINMDTNLDCSACARYDVSKTDINFSIVCPIPGRYTFTAYGKPCDSVSSLKALISHCLVSEAVIEDGILDLPKYNFTWGPNGHFEDLGLFFESPVSSCLTMSTRGVMLPRIRGRSAVIFTVCLYKLTRNRYEAIQGHTIVNHRRNNTYDIHVSPLPMGNYSLVLRGTTSLPGDKLNRCIAMFLIESNLPVSFNELCPRFGHHWYRQQCSLATPSTRNLPKGGTRQWFQVSIADAERVVVVYGSHVTSLQHKSCDIWKGYVNKYETGILTMYAKFQTENNFVKLLEYDIVEHPSITNKSGPQRS